MTGLRLASKFLGISLCSGVKKYKIMRLKGSKKATALVFFFVGSNDDT